MSVSRNAMLKFTGAKFMKRFIWVAVILTICNIILLYYAYILLEEYKIRRLDDNQAELQNIGHGQAERYSRNDENIEGKRNFRVDYSKNEFLLDGKPFRYISGSIHYFRIPKAYWRDRLQKFKAAGLNAISMYVEWSSHEPSPGNYVFKDNLDLEYFLELAFEEGLLVLFRPGPYICAERDFGGLPPWLLTVDPFMKLRTSDKNYQYYVKKWFDVLMPKIKRFLYENGGPIIMVQVENEYGSYPACDKKHKMWLANLFRDYVEDAALLYTTDGNGASYLRCGVIPNVYATVDFGTNANVSASFEAMRLYTPKGPLVNSEFYPGWLTHWEEKVASVNTSRILATMVNMLEMKASFNFYMFHGGTNFGFTAGANYADPVYMPDITSYDYDAPLTEAGDPTEKYFAIRNFIAGYLKKNLSESSVPAVSAKGDYGLVEMRPVISLFDQKIKGKADSVRGNFHEPKTFEEIGLNYGFMLYETKVPFQILDPAVLNVADLRDRAIVFLDEKPVGILSRARLINELPLMAAPGQKLSLLVENQGRINFGERLKDFKGIVGSVMLGKKALTNWTHTGYELNELSWLESTGLANKGAIYPPAFYRGEFVVSKNVAPLDTFLDPTGWGKGVLFVNGVNLGRYWPSTGPQVTLYIPGCYLKPHPFANTIVLFELEHTPKRPSVKFSTSHIFSTPILAMTESNP